ncbi:MAG: NAD-dependent epimerase/dehydratase family protein [Planctomycetota bacterium]
MLIAVTGATGFIGRYLTRRLLADGARVRVLARPGRTAALELDDAPGRETLEIHEGDLTDPASLKGFLDDATHLVHLASAHDHYSEEVMKDVNITGTEHLVAEAERVSPECQVVLVSSAVIGVPVYGYYRDSKRVQEKVVRGSKLPWASFRPTLVYGRGDFRHTAPLLRKCGAKKGNYWVFHEGLSSSTRCTSTTWSTRSSRSSAMSARARSTASSRSRGRSASRSTSSWTSRSRPRAAA